MKGQFINIDKKKSPEKDFSANEAHSAPNKPNGIAAFIKPDSMLDIFGEDYMPPAAEPEIKVET